MVRFPLTQAAHDWLVSGAQSGWAPLTPTVIAGAVPSVPNWLWTGSSGSLSFIFAKDQGGGGNTFAASFSDSNSFDDCDGNFDQASLVRVFYR